MLLEIFIGISCVALIFSTWRTLNLYNPRTLKELIFGEVAGMLVFTAMCYAAVITLFCKLTGQPVPAYMNLYLIGTSQ